MNTSKELAVCMNRNVCPFCNARLPDWKWRWLRFAHVRQCERCERKYIMRDVGKGCFEYAHL